MTLEFHKIEEVCRTFFILLLLSLALLSHSPAQKFLKRNFKAQIFLASLIMQIIQTILVRSTTSLEGITLHFDVGSIPLSFQIIPQVFTFTI